MGRVDKNEITLNLIINEIIAATLSARSAKILIFDSNFLNIRFAADDKQGKKEKL
jgi:hypothetical protein